MIDQQLPDLDREDLQTNRDDKRLINAIATLSTLEDKIPECRTIDQVEEIRAFSQGIQHQGREIGNVGERIVEWAKRVAVKCQLQITRIQLLAKAKRNGEVASVSNFATKDPARRSDEKLVASLPENELNEHLQSSGSVQRIARKVRQQRKEKRVPKSSPEELKSSRERYYRAKAKKQEKSEVETAPKSNANRENWTSDKFRTYWTQEQKLLGKFFSINDLDKLETLWVRAFQSYRTEVEAAKQERDSALARLKQRTIGKGGPVPA